MDDWVGMIGSFIPILVVGLLWGLISLPISRRKGESQALYFLLMMIPFINFIIMIFLAAKTDKSVLERIEKLERESGAAFNAGSTK